MKQSHFSLGAICFLRWRDLTFVGSDLTGGDLTMERGDRIPFIPTPQGLLETLSPFIVINHLLLAIKIMIQIIADTVPLDIKEPGGITSVAIVT